MARKYTLSTTCFVILFSMISLIAGRSRTTKSSGNNATSTDVSEHFQNAGTSIHPVDDRNSDARSATRVNVLRTASLKEKKRKTKSNRKARRNRRRKKARTSIDSNNIIRDTMIHVLGFNSMPTRSDCEGAECRRQATSSEHGARSGRLPPDSLDSAQFKPHPPDFMLELYRSYAEDKDLMILQSKSQGNTVRSFFPSPANSRNRETNFGQAIVIAPVPETGPEFSPTSAFLYNVTLIPALEDLVAAEIRLDGSWVESDTVVMVGIYKKRTECDDGIDCEIFTKVGKTLILRLVSDKTWTDRKLAKITKRARRNDHVLIVKFVAEPQAGGDTASQRTRRHFEKDSDLPQSFIPRDGPVARSKRSPGNVDGDSESLSPMIPIFIAYCNDPRASSNPESFHAAPVIWKALENVTATSRVRRSDGSSRELPPADTPSERDSLATKPKEKRTTDASSRSPVLVVEKRKKSSKRKRKKNRENTQLSINGTQIVNESQARKSKRNRNRGKRGRRRNKARKYETIDIGLHSSLLSEEKTKSCERRSLTVSFADIGWSSAIITPKNFEAYYCSGSCDLPDHEGETKATNHAVIQSVVRNIGGRRELPSPCCVPDKLMPLSVLYFDQDSNVVLKVFPNMSVETCGCR